MRVIAATGLTGAIVLATVGLTAASSIGAASDGLSSDTMLSGANFGPAFSGAAARVPDDPDAPIRTGRWEEAPAPVLALLGGPEVDTRSVTPARMPVDRPAVQMAALTPPPSARALADSVAAPSPVIKSRVALASVSSKVLAGGPRVSLSVSGDRDATEIGSGLAVEGQAFAPRPPRESQPFDARRLLVSIAPEPADRKKGRWFVFAAGSGEAFGLNIVRDPARGWRRTGWSVERLAEFGKAQLGVGWRRGDRQVAVSAARREIGLYGYKREDTVLGVTFTVSGKPAQKVKYEYGIPKNTIEPVRNSVR